MNEIIIAGQKIEARALSKQESEGMWLELIANFDMKQFEFNGQTMLLFADKNAGQYSPLQRKKISERVEMAKQLPVVFFFNSLKTFERDRLVEQGVYFLVSDKYAFLPTLIINRKETEKEVKDLLTPSAQYIMLYHLQVTSINGMNLTQLEEHVPYKYKTIARSVNQLQNLGLLKLEGGKEKRIVINDSNAKLWESSKQFLVNPIKATYFSALPFEPGKTGGISALTHYSMLAPEDVPTKVITYEQFKELRREDYPFLPFEDVQRIEVWKYPPLSENGYVDRLSLYLTLKDDNDPRVQKELETMIRELPW